MPLDEQFTKQPFKSPNCVDKIINRDLIPGLFMLNVIVGTVIVFVVFKKFAVNGTHFNENKKILTI